MPLFIALSRFGRASLCGLALAFALLLWLFRAIGAFLAWLCSLVK